MEDIHSIRCSVDELLKAWITSALAFCMTGMCFKDLPGCDHNFPSGQCFGVKQGVSDAWCVESSKSIDGPFGAVTDFYDKCICEELVIGTNTPIEELHKPINASKMAPRSPELVQAAMEREKNFPGLPDCTWKPGPGCTNETQYECMAGAKAGQCSADNWYYKANVCTSSCVPTIMSWFLAKFPSSIGGVAPSVVKATID